MQRRRKSLLSVTMDQAMTSNPSFATGRFPQRIRFVIVNERVPRTGGHCAFCGGIIEKGYVRDARTRFTYCLPHAASAVPRVENRARKVS